MRATSPPPTSDPPSRPGVPSARCAEVRGGFSLLEVLVAVVVASLLCAVAASSAFTVLRAETLERDLAAARFAVDTLAARCVLGLPPAGGRAPDAAWACESAAARSGKPPLETAWTVWTVWPSARPALRATIALRAGDAPAVPPGVGR